MNPEMTVDTERFFKLEYPSAQLVEKKKMKITKKK